MGKKRKPRIKANYKTKNFIDYVLRRLQKKYPEIQYTDVAAILRLYHELAREDLATGEPFYFKKNLGALQVYKEKREVKLDENGKIINNLPINFPETLKLWKEKPELRNKRFIRFVNEHSDGFYFRLKYQLGRARFKYKNVYKFNFNDTLKEKLAKNIIDGKAEAYINKY